MKPLYAAFTMDCEQLAAQSFAGGPADWDLSARAIRGYADALRRRDFRATFFIIPQAAVKHADLFLELQTEGHELGLHLHAVDQGWRDFIGGLTPSELRAALSAAIEIWANALGQAPVAFRAGHFSTNDHLFPILCEFGFTHGSASLPQRRVVHRKAVWEGALPYPHWAHEGNRLLAGDLPFFEVPAAAHPERRHGRGDELPWEVRIEGSDWTHHAETVQAHLDWQIALDAPMIASTSFTHNTKEYSDPENEMSKRLSAMMDILESEALHREMVIQKQTLGGIYAVALAERQRLKGAANA